MKLVLRESQIQENLDRIKEISRKNVTYVLEDIQKRVEKKKNVDYNLLHSFFKDKVISSPHDKIFYENAYENQTFFKNKMKNF